MGDKPLIIEAKRDNDLNMGLKRHTFGQSLIKGIHSVALVCFNK